MQQITELVLSLLHVFVIGFVVWSLLASKSSLKMNLKLLSWNWQSRSNFSTNYAEEKYSES